MIAHHAYRIWCLRLVQLKHFYMELEKKTWCNVIHGHQTEVVIAFLTLLEHGVLDYIHIQMVHITHWRFREIHCLQLQGWRVSQERNQQKARSKQNVQHTENFGSDVGLKRSPEIYSSLSCFHFYQSTWHHIPDENGINFRYICAV